MYLILDQPLSDLDQLVMKVMTVHVDDDMVVNIDDDRDDGPFTVHITSNFVCTWGLCPFSLLTMTKPCVHLSL